MLVFNRTLLATKQPTYEGTLTKTDTSRQVIKITNAYDGRDVDVRISDISNAPIYGGADASWVHITVSDSTENSNAIYFGNQVNGNSVSNLDALIYSQSGAKQLYVRTSNYYLTETGVSGMWGHLNLNTINIHNTLFMQIYF